MGKGDVSGNLDTMSALHHNSGMKRPLLSGFTILVALATLTRSAPACGDPPALGVAGTKAQLVVQGRAGSVRIGEPISANLILPKGSQRLTGTLSRASCTSLQFTVEPASGWHDPWADWYYSGIPQHATGKDGPRTCGVVGYLPGTEIPPPQIRFTLNDWIEFDRPGKYKISVTYRTEFRNPQEVLDDPYDDRKSAVNITLATDPVEVDVLPEVANVASLASDALILLQSHFRRSQGCVRRSRRPVTFVPFRAFPTQTYAMAFLPVNVGDAACGFLQRSIPLFFSFSSVPER